MSSRRQGRYERRMEKRKQHKELLNQQVGSLEDVFTYQDMYIAGKKCCNGVRWKKSTQDFERHLFSKTAVNREQILNRTWKPSSYHHFMLMERGKVRPIDAPLIKDRQIEKVFAKKVLLPLYEPTLIYNNGASLPKKGLNFSKEQLKKDLHWHFNHYQREGSIIILDFKSFFPEVPHTELYKNHNKFIYNNDLKNIANQIVNTLPGGKGLPLGVEPSQIEMVAFPSPLDNFIKCQLSIKYMGHYMDDYYIIVPPDKDVKEILKQVISKAESLGLIINYTKTRILPLTKPFKYCKVKYTLTKTGKIITNGNTKNFQRARRKIKAFKQYIDEGKMTLEDLWMSMNGIIAYFKQFNDHNKILKIRRIFYAIFGFSVEKINNFKVAETG